MKIGMFSLLLILGLGFAGGYYGHDSIKGGVNTASNQATNTYNGLRK